MKIIIAPDSFKESLSASAVADAIERGLRRALPDTAPSRCGIARWLTYGPLPGEHPMFAGNYAMTDLHTRSLRHGRPHRASAGRCPHPHHAIVRHGGPSARS